MRLYNAVLPAMFFNEMRYDVYIEAHVVAVILPVLYWVPFPLCVPDTFQLNCSKTINNNPQRRCNVVAAAALIIQFVLMFSIVERHNLVNSLPNIPILVYHKNHSRTPISTFSLHNSVLSLPEYRSIFYLHLAITFGRRM